MHFFTVRHFNSELVNSCLPFHFVCSFNYAFCPFHSFSFFIPLFMSKTSFSKFYLPKQIFIELQFSWIINEVIIFTTMKLLPTRLKFVDAFIAYTMLAWD